MQTISSMNPARAPRKIIAISIGLLSTILLASCGGGGSTDPNATAQSVDDGTKTIQAVSGSTAVPGTWTGRAPKMEVINGITVPPEPAPTINNATLAGVDVNNNGVRDDVERAVANNSTGPTDFANSLLYAKYYNELAIASTPTNREVALLKLKAFRCSGFDSSVLPKPLLPSGSSSLMGAVFNTKDRRSKLLAFNKVVGAYEGSEVSCD